MKIIILVLFFSLSGFTKDLTCFKGKVNQDFIDQVCFNLEQVETFKASATPGVLEVKVLNVQSPLLLFTSIEAFKKKLK